MSNELPDLNPRYEYDVGELDEAALGSDPISALRRWLAEAGERDPLDFNAMVLATVDPDGQPAARTVLLRGVDEGGNLRFFSNSQSRKGLAVAANPRVSLLFIWSTAHRQLHVEGTCVVAAAEVSDRYWVSRPRDSQLASVASPQSSVITGREWLADRMAELEEEVSGGEVPRPDNSVMFEVRPVRFEFWHGRPHRLHDRIEFRKSEDGSWERRRLAP